MLIDENTQLRDECISSLDASHNYHSHTKIAWRLVQQMVRQDHKFTIRNHITGNTVNEMELSSLAQGFVIDFLAPATFQNFVALFERFVFDLLRRWLTEYPGSLSGNQLKFQLRRSGSRLTRQPEGIQHDCIVFQNSSRHVGMKSEKPNPSGGRLTYDYSKTA